MKIQRSIWSCWMVLFTVTGLLPLAGQSAFDPSFYPEAFLIRDHLEVFTDRSVYIVGEKIRFRADYRVEGVDAGIPWSTILYAELVTAAGNPVSQGKFVISDGKSSGSLHVPPGALTGNYFIKCYTRWMRNSGPRAFSFIPIKIVNPYRPDVVRHANGNEPDPAGERREMSAGTLDCSILKPVYGKGEEVRFRVTGPLDNRLREINCCITVVPVGSIDTEQGQIIFPGSTMNPNDYRVNYLPDLKGVSLSGTVLGQGPEQIPVQSARVYFSLLGTRPDYFAIETDEQGRFVITTPDREGNQELFVAPDPSLEGEAEVRIDQDFDSGELPVHAGEFKLTEMERHIAVEMALKTQLARVFQAPVNREQLPADSRPAGAGLFYGTPKFTLLLDDYITLPTLEEVFVNLVPDVGVEVHRGIRSFWINSPNSAIHLYQPLILMDNLPVFDHQVVLGIHPEKILKIDVINEVYVKGNVSHGGIISIFSRNGDMAGIDLAPNSYFIDFQSTQPADSPVHQVYASEDRVPDMRNTLLWVDDLLLESSRPRELSMVAPATPGEYVILVRGVAHRGHVVGAKAYFTVE